MSKERELLKRVRDTLLELKETHYDLYWDIQAALDLREGLREEISLRDHFAGLAMQVLLVDATSMNNAARNAYDMADLMLTEREKNDH